MVLIPLKTALQLQTLLFATSRLQVISDKVSAQKASLDKVPKTPAMYKSSKLSLQKINFIVKAWQKFAASPLLLTNGCELPIKFSLKKVQNEKIITSLAYCAIEK